MVTCKSFDNGFFWTIQLHGFGWILTRYYGSSTKDSVAELESSENRLRHFSILGSGMLIVDAQHIWEIET
jgi:hypothetical protein